MLKKKIFIQNHQLEEYDHDKKLFSIFSNTLLHQLQ